MKKKWLGLVAMIIMCLATGTVFAADISVTPQYDSNGNLDIHYDGSTGTRVDYEYDDNGNMTESSTMGIQLQYLNSSDVLEKGSKANFVIAHQSDEDYTYGLQMSTDQVNWSIEGAIGTNKELSVTRSVEGTVFIRGFAKKGTLITYSQPVRVEFFAPLKVTGFDLINIDESSTKLSASAEGKGVLYRFKRRNTNGTWTTLRNYSSANQYIHTYTGSKNATEVYRVEVIDSKTSDPEILTKQRDYIVTPSITVNGTSTEVSTAVGNSATINISNKSDFTNYQYQFEKSTDRSNWTTMKSFSSIATYKYKESSPLTNWVRVTARKNGRTYTSNSTKVTFVHKLTLDSFTKTVEAPNKLQLSANATGADVDYTFYKSVDFGEWEKLTTNTSGYYTHISSDSYDALVQFKVIVQDAYQNSVTSDVLVHRYGMKPLTFTSLVVTTDSSAEEYIDVTAYGSGESFASFKCVVRSGSGTLLTTKTLTPGVRWRYYPNIMGDIKVTVTANDEISRIVKSKTVTLKKSITPFILTDLRSFRSYSSGRENLKIYSENGVNAEYAFYYKKSSSYSWTRIRGYSRLNNVYWTPPSKGSYYIRVLAIDDNNPTPKEYIELIYCKGPAEDTGGSGGGGGSIIPPYRPPGGGELAF